MPSMSSSSSSFSSLSSSSSPSSASSSSFSSRSHNCSLEVVPALRTADHRRHHRLRKSMQQLLNPSPPPPPLVLHHHIAHPLCHSHDHPYCHASPPPPRSDHHHHRHRRHHRHRHLTHSMLRAKPPKEVRKPRRCMLPMKNCCTTKLTSHPSHHHPRYCSPRPELPPPPPEGVYLFGSPLKHHAHRHSPRCCLFHCNLMPMDGGRNVGIRHFHRRPHSHDARTHGDYDEGKRDSSPTRIAHPRMKSLIVGAFADQNPEEDDPKQSIHPLPLAQQDGGA